MIRQRIALRTPLLAYLVRLLTVVLALILIWYGAMLVLLAAKVSPHTVNSLSGYHTLYREAAGLHRGDFTRKVRLIVGFAGFIAFLFFLFLALQEVPRPYLARREVTLDERDSGSLTVGPRAIERVAEVSANAHKDVASASGRLGDESLNVSVSVRNAGTLAETLRAVRDGVAKDLAQHELPALPVNVTATGYDPKNRRQLS